MLRWRNNRVLNDASAYRANECRRYTIRIDEEFLIEAHDKSFRKFMKRLLWVVSSLECGNLHSKNSS
jgi:hypothetical protein